MIVVSAGMPRSGTGWVYQLTNELLVASGQPSSEQIRKRFGLGCILREHNCNVGRPSIWKLAILTVPHICRRSFAVKTHRRPTSSVKVWMRAGVIKSTYIYRDPRDVVVSAFEAGKEFRRRGLDKSFARLNTLDQAIEAVSRWLRIFKAWSVDSSVLKLRYEDLKDDPIQELRRLQTYLGLKLQESELHRIAARLDQGGSVAGSHFRKGVSGRYRQVLSPQQIESCQQRFGTILEKMGYEIADVGSLTR